MCIVINIFIMTQSRDVICFLKIYNSERQGKLLHNMPNFYVYSFQIRPRALTVDVSIATSQ